MTDSSHIESFAELFETSFAFSQPIRGEIRNATILQISERRIVTGKQIGRAHV